MTGHESGAVSCLVVVTRVEAFVVVMLFSSGHESGSVCSGHVSCHKTWSCCFVVVTRVKAFVVVMRVKGFVFLVTGTSWSIIYCKSSSVVLTSLSILSIVFLNQVYFLFSHLSPFSPLYF